MQSIQMLRSVNMNLLPILAELLRCANVTNAAAQHKKSENRHGYRQF